MRSSLPTAAPGWYVAPLDVVELVPELRHPTSATSLRPLDGENPLGLVYVYVSPVTRSLFYAAANRCSRSVHRLSEAEVRRLRLELADSRPPDLPEPVATTAAASTFADDRPHLALWLAQHLPAARPFGLLPTPDRGAALCELLPPSPALTYRIAWVTPNLAPRTVYLRLHGGPRSDLDRRYCSPFRRADDPELLSFRRALGVAPLDPAASPDPWRPVGGP